MVYRKSERVEQRLADRRRAIVRATRDLVAEVGFREAQVAEIAARAGIAAGTIYRYFPSKGELFAEVLAVTSEREVALCAEIASSDEAAASRMYEAVRVFALRAVRGRRLAYALIGEPGDPAIDGARLAYRRSLGQVFGAIIQDGIDAGEFPEQDVESSAACVVGALLEGMLGPLAPDAAAIVDGGEHSASTIAGFCLCAVRGGSAEPRRISAAGERSGGSRDPGAHSLRFGRQAGRRPTPATTSCAKRSSSSTGTSTLVPRSPGRVP